MTSWTPRSDPSRSLLTSAQLALASHPHPPPTAPPPLPPARHPHHPAPSPPAFLPFHFTSSTSKPNVSFSHARRLLDTSATIHDLLSRIRSTFTPRPPSPPSPAPPSAPLSLSLSLKGNLAMLQTLLSTPDVQSRVEHVHVLLENITSLVASLPPQTTLQDLDTTLQRAHHLLHTPTTLQAQLNIMYTCGSLHSWLQPLESWLSAAADAAPLPSATLALPPKLAKACTPTTLSSYPLFSLQAAASFPTPLTQAVSVAAHDTSLFVLTPTGLHVVDLLSQTIARSSTDIPDVSPASRIGVVNDRVYIRDTPTSPTVHVISADTLARITTQPLATEGTLYSSVGLLHVFQLMPATSSHADGEMIAQITSFDPTSSPFRHVSTHTLAKPMSSRAQLFGAYALGSNYCGQLGVSTASTTSDPQLISIPNETPQWVACEAGHDASFLIDASGRMWVSGRNSAGELGDAVVDMTPRFRLHDSPILRNHRVAQISCSNSSCFALIRTETGELFVTGDFGLDFGPEPDTQATLYSDAEDDLSTEQTTRRYRRQTVAISSTAHTVQRQCVDSRAPRPVPLPRSLETGEPVTVTSISAGATAAAFVTESGDVFTWGTGIYGYLGHGEVECVRKPRRIADLPPCSKVCFGAQHVVFLARDSRVFASGRNMSHQLGIGSSSNRSTPTLVPDTPPDIVDMTCGDHHTLLLTKGGAVWGFGSNKHGALGVNPTVRRMLLTPTTLPLPLTRYGGMVRHIAAGRESSYFVTTSGHVLSLGHDSYGELGRPAHSLLADQLASNEDRHELGDVISLDDVQARGISRISVGNGHTLMVAGDCKGFEIPSDEPLSVFSNRSSLVIQGTSRTHVFSLKDDSDAVVDDSTQPATANCFSAKDGCVWSIDPATGELTQRVPLSSKQTSPVNLSPEFIVSRPVHDTLSPPQLAALHLARLAMLRDSSVAPPHDPSQTMDLLTRLLALAASPQPTESLSFCFEQLLRFSLHVLKADTPPSLSEERRTQLLQLLQTATHDPHATDTARAAYSAALSVFVPSWEHKLELLTAAVDDPHRLRLLLGHLASHTGSFALLEHDAFWPLVQRLVQHDDQAVASQAVVLLRSIETVLHAHVLSDSSSATLPQLTSCVLFRVRTLLQVLQSVPPDTSVIDHIHHVGESPLATSTAESLAQFALFESLPQVCELVRHDLGALLRELDAFLHTNTSQEERRKLAEDPPFEMVTLESPHPYQVGEDYIYKTDFSSHVGIMIVEFNARSSLAKPDDVLTITAERSGAMPVTVAEITGDSPPDSWAVPVVISGHSLSINLSSAPQRALPAGHAERWGFQCRVTGFCRPKHDPAWSWLFSIHQHVASLASAATAVQLHPTLAPPPTLDPVGSQLLESMLVANGLDDGDSADPRFAAGSALLDDLAAGSGALVDALRQQCPLPDLGKTMCSADFLTDTLETRVGAATSITFTLSDDAGNPLDGASLSDALALREFDDAAHGRIPDFSSGVKFTTCVDSPLPQPLAQMACASHPNGLIYLFGGVDAHGQDVASVWSFDPETDRYTSLKPMPKPNRGCTATLLDDHRVLVAGGAANTLFIYDPALDTWESRGAKYVPPTRPHAGDAPAKNHHLGGGLNGWTTRACRTGSLVHFLGGEQGLRDHCAYDPHHDEWLIQPDSLPVNFKQHGAAAAGGRLFAFGGTSSLNSKDVGGPMYSFEPSEQTSQAWTKEADMPHPLCMFGWDATSRQIVVLGGSTSYRNGGAPLYKSLLVFDVKTRQWLESPARLPEGVRENAVCIHGGRLHSFGGSRGSPVTTHTVCTPTLYFHDESAATPSSSSPLESAKQHTSLSLPTLAHTSGSGNFDFSVASQPNSPEITCTFTPRTAGAFKLVLVLANSAVVPPGLRVLVRPSEESNAPTPSPAPAPSPVPLLAQFQSGGVVTDEFATRFRSARTADAEKLLRSAMPGFAEDMYREACASAQHDAHLAVAWLNEEAALRDVASMLSTSDTLESLASVDSLSRSVSAQSVDSTSGLSWAPASALTTSLSAQGFEASVDVDVLGGGLLHTSSTVASHLSRTSRAKFAEAVGSSAALSKARTVPLVFVDAGQEPPSLSQEDVHRAHAAVFAVYVKHLGIAEELATLAAEPEDGAWDKVRQLWKQTGFAVRGQLLRQFVVDQPRLGGQGASAERPFAASAERIVNMCAILLRFKSAPHPGKRTESSERAKRLLGRVRQAAHAFIGARKLAPVRAAPELVSEASDLVHSTRSIHGLEWGQLTELPISDDVLRFCLHTASDVSLEEVIGAAEFRQQRADRCASALEALLETLEAVKLNSSIWTLIYTLHATLLRPRTVSQHPLHLLHGAGTARVETVREWLHAVLNATVPLLMDDDACASPRQKTMLLDLWRICFTQGDHEFLHRCGIFSALQQTMVSGFDHAGDGEAAVQPLPSVRPSMDVTTEAHYVVPGMFSPNVGDLLDPFSEETWDVEAVVNPFTKELTPGRVEVTLPRSHTVCRVSLYLDAHRDVYSKAKGVLLFVPTAVRLDRPASVEEEEEALPESLRDAEWALAHSELHLDDMAPHGCFYSISCSVDTNVLRLVFRGKRVRVRALRVLALEPAAPHTVLRSGNSAMMSRYHSVEALTTFHALASQSFSRVLSGFARMSARRRWITAAERVRACANDSALRGEIVDMVLQPGAPMTQGQLRLAIVHLLATEFARERKRMCRERAWLALGDGVLSEATVQWSGADATELAQDAYVYELAQTLESVAQSPEGLAILASPTSLPVLFSLLGVASPRVQAVVARIVTSVLPTIDRAGIAGSIRHGPVKHLFFALSRALHVEVTVEEHECFKVDRGARVVQDVLGDGVTAWTACESILASLRDLRSHPVWSEDVHACLVSGLTAANIRRACSMQRIDVSRLWLALAALCVLGEDDSLFEEYSEECGVQIARDGDWVSAAVQGQDKTGAAKQRALLRVHLGTLEAQVVYGKPEFFVDEELATSAEVFDHDASAATDGRGGIGKRVSVEAPSVVELKRKYAFLKVSEKKKDAGKDQKKKKQAKLMYGAPKAESVTEGLVAVKVPKMSRPPRSSGGLKRWFKVGGVLASVGLVSYGVWRWAFRDDNEQANHSS